MPNMAVETAKNDRWYQSVTDSSLVKTIAMHSVTYVARKRPARNQSRETFIQEKEAWRAARSEGRAPCFSPGGRRTRAQSYHARAACERSHDGRGFVRARAGRPRRGAGVSSIDRA